MSDAAVGSISHILKTAFKDVYTDYAKREDAAKAREDILIAQEEERKRKEAEELAAAEAAAADAAANKKKGGAAAAAAKKQEDAKKKGGADPVVEAPPVVEPPPEPQVLVDPSTLVENYFAPIEKLKLDPQYADMLENKTTTIKAVNTDKRQKAEDLQTYLTQQRETAKHLEELEEEELKRRGIMIGQHIPSLPTKLDIGKERISTQGNFSDNIVVAKDLVESNREMFLRRTGNMPISSLAAQRLLERTSKSQITLDPKEPHYVSKTSNTATRIEGISKRFELTLSMAAEEKAAKEAAAPKVARKKFPQKTEFMSPAQEIENARILHDMTHKNNYLRNPRNNPKSVDRMLTKAKTGSNSSKDDAAAAGGHQAEGDSVTASVESKKSYKKSAPVLNNPLFVAEPRSIEFNGYEIGVAQTVSISLRNVSTISRCVRVWPVKTNNFVMTPLQYPANCKGGFIAPGMCVTTQLTFTPDSLGDYAEFLKVETEGGNFSVPITAQRDSPCLNLPNNLNVGVCLVGDASRSVFQCYNSGGVGKFRFLHPDNYPSVPSDFDWQGMGCVRTPPFTVYPIEFTLKRNESIDVTVEYVPRTLGNHESNLYLLCDNSQVQDITLRGSSRQVDVSIIEVNTVAIDDKDSNLKRNLYFDDVCIGAEQSQQFVVSNTTNMPLEYEWVWLPMNTANIRKAALEKIAAREEQEAIAAQSMLEGDFGINEASKPSSSAAAGAEAMLLADDERSGLLSPLSAGGAPPSSTPVPPSRNTIESLIESISGPKTMANSAADGEFSITPARGVFPADELGVTFEVSFSPVNLAVASKKAVLMLKHIPQAALPGSKGQGAALTRLEAEGHGDYHRLRSWLEEIGELGIVPQYTKPNGDKSTQAKITSIQTILDMVSTNAAASMTEKDRIRMMMWTRQLILHAYACENRLLQVDEDEEAANEEVTNTFASDSPNSKTQIVMYNWSGDFSEEPVPLYPLKLSSLGLSDKRDDGRSPEEWEVEDNLINANKHTMRTKWLDCWTALHLLDRTICQILDDRVRHEAVDYIKDCAHATVVCLNTSFSGRGAQQMVTVSPPLISIPGKLAIGSVWHGKVQVVNDSQAMAEAEVDYDNITIRPIAMDSYTVFNESDALDVDNALNSKRFQVEIVPNRILLMPESAASVDVNVVSLHAGKYEITVPLRSRSSYSMVDSIVVQITVCGPRIHFNSNEVDVGLVGVGAVEERVVTFSNEGDVPCKYMFKCNLEAGESFAGVKDKGGIDSRLNSARSNRSDGDQTSVTRDSFMIDNPTTGVLIDPPAGMLGPGQTAAVLVKCKAGSQPQRVRGNIECTLFDDSGQMRLLSQFLSIRGEIQVPKTVLYPMTINLGKVFVSIPVYFDIFLENKCNLPTKFKFERPGGDSPAYKLVFDNPRGSLDQKEIQKIRVEFTALSAGAIDDVVACKCFGVKLPLGFSIAAVAAGIKMEYVPLLEGGLAPRPLAAVTDRQYTNQESPPEPVATVPLDLGKAVDLYERRMVRMTIRNMTPIATTFNLAVGKFLVKNLMKNASSNSKVIVQEDGSIIEDDGERKDLILGPHEDGTNKFRSEGGKKYIAVRLQRKEDRKFLKSGLGASYSIEPAAGKLDPWGVQVITVRSYNDMPGCYDDDMYCTVVDGNGAKRESAIPLQMTVLGCPLIIEKDTIGMSRVYESRGNPEDVNKQLLQMGHACVNADPLVRTFTVRNNGSKSAKLKWKLKQSNAVVNGPLRFRLDLDENSKLKSKFQFWSDFANETAYTVEPDKAVIAPYERQVFTVTLLRTELIGNLTASLTGLIGIDESVSERRGSMDITSNTQSASTLDLNAGAGGSKYSLFLLVEGNIHYPTVSIDKNVFVAKESPTIPPASFSIKLKTQAPQLYASGTRPSEVCQKPITVINPLDANLMFSVVTEGPFTIKSNDAVQPMRGANESMASSSAVSVRSQTTVGKPYFLLPNVRFPC
jgi:hypothetical protein